MRLFLWKKRDLLSSIEDDERNKYFKFYDFLISFDLNQEISIQKVKFFLLFDDLEKHDLKKDNENIGMFLLLIIMIMWINKWSE